MTTRQPDVFVIIGAGSTVFTPGLLNDLARSPVFDDATVRLVDIQPESAETMAAVGRRIAEENGSNLVVEAVGDRRAALTGATFVVTTIATGSAESWKRDLDIPRRLGISQTVGDSVGPGGVFRALRHIPELLTIAADIADISPAAYLFNYSNPLTPNVRAITRETPVRAFGLCHGTMHTKTALAEALGVAPADLTATFAGLNHLSWLLELRAGHDDLYPRLRELVAAQAADAEAPSSRVEGPHAAVSADLLRRFGLYPAPGDRHVAEFFTDYLQPSGLELRWGLQGGLDTTHEYINEKGALWEHLREYAAVGSSIAAFADKEAERLVAIAEAIRTGRRLLELAVNLPNRGLISNLPDIAVVEVPAAIDGDGVHGLAVGTLPESVATTLAHRAHQQETTVDAAISGHRDLAVHALVLDPLVPDRETAVALLDAAAAADPTYLGRYAEDVPAATNVE
ncbi:hypothetical protein [Paramicrobacterium agarici]|uniref:Alpha-galactosidase n=1 Tax=Paramicrobacterium agarici TaxID=630514 RepID=A0A2A9DWG8_9MICO|nr:hypothetical protein [Microbacterium agarici]PFG30691.1 alpha-galactosidase [Microbacterium agarici]